MCIIESYKSLLIAQGDNLEQSTLKTLICFFVVSIPSKMPAVNYLKVKQCRANLYLKAKWYRANNLRRALKIHDRWHARNIEISTY